MRYNPRLHCSAGCRRADGRATSEPYQMRVRPSRGPGGRGRRGRAGGHGATSSQGEARADWRRRRGQGWRGRPPVARPDKIIDPCTGGAGSHGSSRPPVTRRAVASPLTSALSPLGPARPSQGRQLCKFLLFLKFVPKESGQAGGLPRLSTLTAGGWGGQQVCPAAAGKHCVCVPTLLEKNPLNTSFWGQRRD